MLGRQWASVSRGRELLSPHSAGSCLPRWCKRARRRDIASPPGAADQHWAVRGHAGFSKSNIRAGILFCNVSRSPKCWPLIGLHHQCWIRTVRQTHTCGSTSCYCHLILEVLTGSGDFGLQGFVSFRISIHWSPWCLFSYDFPLNQSRSCVVHME